MLNKNNRNNGLCYLNHSSSITEFDQIISRVSNAKFHTEIKYLSLFFSPSILFSFASCYFLHALVLNVDEAQNLKKKTTKIKRK